MTCGETQRGGYTYYWYKPTLGQYPHRKVKWGEMYLWAVDNFGYPNHPDHIPPHKWYAVSLRFNFLKEEDRMYMIMRWA